MHCERYHAGSSGNYIFEVQFNVETPFSGLGIEGCHGYDLTMHEQPSEQLESGNKRVLVAAFPVSSRVPFAVP